MITQAVIAAGGFGKRLWPLTDTVPKPMLSLLGKPLLEYNFEQFKKHGVTEFFLTLHYLPDIITSHFGDGTKWGVRMHYFVEEEPLGTAGGIKRFAPELNDEFFFIYGDMISLVDYTKMAAMFAAKKDAIGMQRVKRTDVYADTDVAELDDDGQFVAIHAKPHTERYPNAYRLRGVSVFTKKMLSYIPDSVPYEIGKQLFPALVAAGERIYGYECDEYSKGIDTMEKLEEVKEYLREHSV